jgi:hypothetical protein
MTSIAGLRADVNRRAAAIFAAIDDYEEQHFIAEIDALAAELPAGDPDGLFHRACAQDSWGHSEQAIPLYRKALDIGGLTGENRRRAVIQMTSSMRNTGQAESALKLLVAERDHGSDPDYESSADALVVMSPLNRPAGSTRARILSSAVICAGLRWPCGCVKFSTNVGAVRPVSHGESAARAWAQQLVIAPSSSGPSGSPTTM